ncbi:MarR family transcriptional regulator [Natrinema gelatinilyticum]|uniref:MarR family transcriptional regulator n=1 Tax=Natrinema gelatinilyticum TaxID=2961571 RepID=UPI0020C589E2|nr:helix-turn-helix domain-containing protein [Natrinema gelatinilyticum]
MSATESETEVDEAAETSEHSRDRTPRQTDGVPDELPPSAKLVYKVLEYEEPLTQAGIVAESRLCPRTVRYALGKLEDRELVTSRACLEDARKSRYRISETE